MTEQNPRQGVKIWEITAQWSGVRLDRWLRQLLPTVPASAVQRWVRTGQVRVNGGRARGETRLQVGDQVRVPPVFVAEPVGGGTVGVPAGVVAELGRAVVWRDELVLVVNKPVGMAVHGGSGHPWGVVDGVRQWLAGQGADPGLRPELCHRLDKETSGCLLFGLQPQAVRSLTAEFRNGRIAKRYLALVRGVPAQASGVISQPLAKGSVQNGERMVVVGHGQRAITEYRVVERLAGCALVEVNLPTGRTHQIRAHFQWLGHPVAGDEKYGEREFNRELRRVGLRRMFLHAASMEFPHPASGERIRVSAGLDPQLKLVLDRLREGGADHEE